MHKCLSASLEVADHLDGRLLNAVEETLVGVLHVVEETLLTMVICPEDQSSDMSRTPGRNAAFNLSCGFHPEYKNSSD